MTRFVFLLLAAFSTTSVFAVEQTVAKSKIKAVTVFFKGAQVFRSADVSIKSGTTKVIFDDVSPLINPKSIQAKSDGKFSILDVKHQLKYPNPQELEPSPIPTKVKRHIILLQDSLAKQQFMMDELTNRLNNLNSEKSMLNNNLLAKGQGRSDSLQLLRQFKEYYRQQLEEIEERIVNLRWRQHLMSKEHHAMQQRLNALKNFQTTDKKPVAPLRVRHQVIVTIEADAYASGDLEINYLVANAGWIPAYDLRAFNSDDPMQLDYRASIYQDTGEDWDNVKLTLSTFTFDINGTLPSLRPEHVGFIASSTAHTATTPISNGTTTLSGTTYTDAIGFDVSTCNAAPLSITSYSVVPTYAWDSAAGNYSVTLTDQNEFFSYKYSVDLPELQRKRVETYQPQPIPEYKAPSESFINVEFKVKRKYSIESDGEETILSVQSEKVNAKYSHYLIPKMDRNAFLITTINDWEQLNLLRANANIYYDNNYVGETSIDPAIISDTMLLSLGRDRAIYCVRKKVKDEEKTISLGKFKQRSITVEVIIKNNKNAEVDLYVKDQIPVSTEEGIEIELLNASKAELDEPSGALTWNIRLKPRQSKTLKFTYTITYEKDKRLAT